MGSTALRRAALALPVLTLVVGASTAALASPRSASARPAPRHEPVPAPALQPAKKADVTPQIGTAVKMVRNPDGSVTVTES